MKRYRLWSSLVFGLFLCFVTLSYAETQKSIHLKAKDLSKNIIKDLLEDLPDEVYLEFQEGDEIPIQYDMKGDVIEFVEKNPLKLKIKKGFTILFLKNEESIKLSWDGKTYLPITDQITGKLEIGAHGINTLNTPVNLINALLEVYKK